MIIHRQISTLINKIDRDWKRANTENDAVTRIERDILIDDLKKLYDLVYELNLMNEVRETKVAAPDKHVIPEKSDRPEPSPAVETTSTPDLFSNETLQGEASESSKEEIIEKDLKPQAAKEFILEKETLEESSETSMVSQDKVEDQAGETPNPHSGHHSVATSEKFQPAKTLADVYQKNGDNSLAAKMQKNRIADIKTAIGINDKFLFINDIFRGEMSAYNKAIEKLNTFSQYHEAVDFVNQIKDQNKVENQEACNKLVDLVKRKFIS